MALGVFIYGAGGALAALRLQPAGPRLDRALARAGADGGVA